MTLWHYRAQLSRVVDGDTVDLAAVDLGFGVHLTESPDKRLRFRLLGIDAPERGQVGWSESKRFVEEWMFIAESVAPDTWPLLIQSEKPMTTDAFGRWLANIYRPDTGESLNDAIVQAGFAVYREWR